MVKHRLCPSVRVYRPVETALDSHSLRSLAQCHGIQGVHFTRQQFMAATIINSGEVLELYRKCEAELSEQAASELGDMLNEALPPSADEYEAVPLSLIKTVRVTRRGVQYAIVAAPSQLAEQERTVLKDALLGHMVDCIGGLAVAEAAVYGWRPQTVGAQLARSYQPEPIDSFYEVLSERAALYLPDSIIYEPPLTEDVMVRSVDTRRAAIDIDGQ